MRQVATHYMNTGQPLLLCEKPLDTYGWKPLEVETALIDELELEADHALAEEEPVYVHLLDQIEDGGRDDTDDEM